MLISKSKEKLLRNRKIQILKKNFLKNSIFGSLVKHILVLSEKNNVEFIYGVPNNKSLQGYTKNLNFKILNNLNISSYTIPCLDIKKSMLNYSALINILLRSYRFIICKIFLKIIN